jgi:UDP-glucose 4-epimerase
MSSAGTPIGPGARALVTGGAGFIGSSLVDRLRTIGADVTVLDNFATGRLEHLAQTSRDVTLVVGDLVDVLRQRRLALESYDLIFHLAANAYVPRSVEDPELDYSINAHGTFSLLEAMRRSGTRARLVSLSSAAVYGEPARQPISEDDVTVPIAPYGVSKLAGERYLAVYAQLYGLQAVSARQFSVYGPRQRKQVVFDLFCKLAANPRRLEVIGDGSATRDLSYVGDVVEALLVLATRAPGQGEAINVASGRSYSIKELVTAICQTCGVEPEVVYSGQDRPGDAVHWRVDVARLLALGYEPRTSLLEGLRVTKEWFDTVDRPV